MMPWIAFKLAICIVLAHIFWHPQRLLDSIGARCDDDHILELTRQIMSILMTLLALLRPISSGLIVALLLLLAMQSVLDSDRSHVESHCVQLGSLDFNTHCLLDIGRLTCFICAMHLILFPRQSTLLRFEQNRARLERFFIKYDPKYASKVEELLKEYHGNERLLFTRLRREYRHVLRPKKQM